MTSPIKSADPAHEYAARLKDRQSRLTHLLRRDDVFANLRLIVFAIGLVLLALSIWRDLTWWWIPFVFAAFVLLLVLHEIALRRKQRAEDAVRFYERAIDRLEGRWAGKGVTGEAYAPPDHVYAADLDLFGRASLFELLCTARTASGEQTLAAWLLAPASADEIRARQGAIEEIRPKLDLREELAVLGGDVRATVKPDQLIQWAESPRVLTSKTVERIAWVFTFAALAGLAAWAFTPIGLSLLMPIVIVEIVFFRWIRHDVHKVAEAISDPAKDLKVLAVVLDRLEREPVNSAKLRQLQESLKAGEGFASKRIARLDQLMQWMDNERNMFFAPFAFIFMWRVHFACALERWRARNGADVRQWLAAVGELEALCALASYAYEHPADPFPDVVDAECVFSGKALGHPLIPDKQSVRNNIELARGAGFQPAVLIVSGSNMSGKSTLLRTVGINTVLALAGAPVRAEALRLAPLAIGATLRIQDSIQAGTSRFYAEITRLRQIMELTKGPLPALFLLDEILAGTNSHDRGIGAEALVKGLLDAGAIGLVTTHDLALTKVVDSLNGRAKNVHFEDHLEGDRLVFDYKMREGVVQKSNALALMRAIGLNV